MLLVSLISCEARKLLLCPSFSVPTFFTLPISSLSNNINTPQYFNKTAFGYEIYGLCKELLMLLPKCNLKRRGAISYHGKPQFDQMFLPISGASPGMGLLGLRMNWHWVSGGRHWSSSRTPGQSVGLVRSRPIPPPRPAALLPPSRMWLILMLKGNSWPEWEESRESDLWRTGTFEVNPW